MNRERRAAPRAKVNLPARWQGAISRQSGTITSISINGCFVLTGGEVEVKELVELEVELPDKRVVHLWCEVVDEANEIGFAVRFNATSDEGEQLLKTYIAQTVASQPKKGKP